MDKKSGKKRNKFPYIEVEEIENRYLDAALLLTAEEGSLDYLLRDELKIIKKAGITPAELRKNKYSQTELIKMVSPHLLENYNFYNFFANNWNDNQENIIKKHIGESYPSLTKEKWQDKIHHLAEENEIPIFAAINLLRFYNNGELKDLISPLLETYAIPYYCESGIQIEGLDINWNEVEAELVEEEPEEFDLSDVQHDGKKTAETLRLASELISSVADQLGRLEEFGELTEMYEREKEQNTELAEKLEAALQEIKVKDARQQALAKENKALSKNIDTLTKKTEQMKKESGKLGLSLGDIRKENEELHKENSSLEKKVTMLQKEQNTVKEKVMKEITQEYELNLRLLKDKHEEEIAAVGRKLTENKQQAEEESYSAEIEKMKKEIESLKNDMHAVENERNDLLEKLRIRQPDAEDEDDIKVFIEFDNKPTRN